MTRRAPTIASTLGLAMALTLALPAFAKEGAEARLDTPLPRDAQPGSTIDVGWTVLSLESDQMHPITGSPVYIRLVGPGAASVTEAMGREDPAGSGHYTASIRVPDGGIGQVIVGLVGESCTAGACQRSDVIFPLTDDPLVTGPAPAGQGSPTSPVATSVSAELAPLVGIGVLIAVAGGLAALVVGRRTVAEAPAGR